MNNNVLQAALACLDAGISVLPIRANGSKAPAMPSWKDCQEKRLTKARARKVFKSGLGIAVIGGEVSGGLEIVDFDKPGVFAEWAARVEEKAPGLVGRLVHHRTPAVGDHLFYRCESVEGNQKLAVAAKPFTDITGKAKTTMIETRGRAGYCLIPPSPHECHESGRTYEHIGGPTITGVPTISPNQRAVLLSVAREFDEKAKAKSKPHEPGDNSGTATGRPGDDFNANGPAWAEIIEPHGWTLDHMDSNGVEHWTRPGKNDGTSATTGACGECLYCFSSNAPPFEEETAYSRFVAFALLNHDGDFSAAAQELARQGYGARGARPSANADTPAGESWDLPIPLQEFDLPIFPVASLPEWLRDFVEAEAVATQTPVDLPAMLGLAATAVCLAKRIWVEIKPGWSEPTNLFAAVVLGPANRKSSVYRDLISPLEEYEAAEAERLHDDIGRAAAERRIVEERLNAAEKRAAKAEPNERLTALNDVHQLRDELSELDVPVAPQLIADDITAEKLALLLRMQGGRMAVMSAEGGGPFGLMRGRYSSSGAPNFEVYLKGHAGDTLKVDRMGRESDHVPYPALTLGLTMQPEVIRSLAEQPSFRGRGLLARFLYSIPASLVGGRKADPPPVSDGVRSDYVRSLRQLLDLDVPKGGVGVPLSREALNALLKYQTEIEPDLADEGDLGFLADWAGKLVGAVARISGLLHIADNIDTPAPWAVEIDHETVEAAIDIGRYLIPHAKAAFSEMGADALLDDCRFVIKRLKRDGRSTLTKREMFTAVRSRIKKVEDLDPVITRLEEHGYIRLQSSKPSSGPGRPASPVYEVNPHLFRDAKGGR